MRYIPLTMPVSLSCNFIFYGTTYQFPKKHAMVNEVTTRTNAVSSKEISKKFIHGTLIFRKLKGHWLKCVSI